MTFLCTHFCEENQVADTLASYISDGRHSKGLRLLNMAEIFLFTLHILISLIDLPLRVLALVSPFVFLFIHSINKN